MIPKCRECGKKLTEVTIKVSKWSTEERWNTREEVRQHANEHAGRPVKVVSFHTDRTYTAYDKETGEVDTELRGGPYTYTYSTNGYKGYSYGTGKYGCEGLGLFCTLRCGYHWAVSKFKRMYGVDN